jgi:hypothetical protein
MPWTPLSPDGTKSVKANTTSMLANTAYIKSTMNIDHYWDIATNEGRHRQTQMPKTQVGGLPTDITLGAGMDGGIYLKETNSRVEGFYRNTNGIYQFIPSFLTGNVALTNLAMANVVAVPNNTYGMIHMFRNDATHYGQFGWFKATGGICAAYAYQASISEAAPTPPSTAFILRFQNKNAIDLQIRAMTGAAAGNGNYQYRITYWAI